MKVAHKIHSKMLEVIDQHGYEILSRYPKDLEIDKAVLERTESKGAQIAWVIGHSHTHLVRIGLHKTENEVVKALVNMSSDDRFFLFTFGHDDFKCKELQRDQFEQLARAPVQYQSKYESDTGFSLYKGEDLIAICQTEILGNLQNQVKQGRYQIKAAFASALDVAAIEIWIERKLSNLTGSMFGKYDIQQA